jgi:hypothetical protein
MPFYSDISNYLKLGFPEPFSDVGRWGNTYAYVGPASALTATPASTLIGTAWADSLLVNQAAWRPFKDNSAYGELTIVTTAIVIAGSFGTTLEQSYTELTWHPVERPLEAHPAFKAGGSADLTGNDSDGKPCQQHIVGWRLESDANLKAQFKYRLITNGVISGTVTTAGTNAQKYLKLVNYGVEAYQDYFPIWTKHSIYTGSVPPSAGSIGAKDTPTGAPSGYEYVKSGDHVVREGPTMRWKRTEEWTGCDKVLLDSTTLYYP